MAATRSADSDLTRGPLGAHLRRMAVPASIGFFFNVLFNVTDTFVAGVLSTDAQAALAFSFPLFFIVLSCSVGLTQATGGLLSRAIGGGKPSRARYFAGQLVVAVVVVGLALAVLGNLIAGPVMVGLNATADQQQLGLEYIRWIFAFAALFHVVMVISGVLSAHGNTTTFRNALIGASLLNLLLDPMLAFGWLGLPALGMHGIGIATVLAQVFMIVWMAPTLLRLPLLQRMRPLHCIPRLTGQKEIATQAVPPTVNMLAICGGFTVVTYYVAAIDTVAVAAYGIALRIEQLVLLLTIGLNIALLSIAGQNFGAGNYGRLHDGFRLANRYGMAITAFGVVFMVALGRQLIGLFNDDPAIVVYGYQYLLAACVLGPFYILIHNSNSMLQAIGKPAFIGPLSIFRIVLLPWLFCWLLVTVAGNGIVGVWYALISANLLATGVIYGYTRGKLRRLPAQPAAT